MKSVHRRKATPYLKLTDVLDSGMVNQQQSGKEEEKEEEEEEEEKGEEEEEEEAAEEFTLAGAVEVYKRKYRNSLRLKGKKTGTAVEVFA